MWIIKLLVRFLWAAFEIADAAVQFVGGWVILWGAGWAMLAALWGFIIEAGPMTIPVAFAAAAASMIFFDALMIVYAASSKASRETIEIAKKLGDLTLCGTDLLYRRSQGQISTTPKESEWWDWMGECVDTVERTNLSDEFYGLKSISDPDEFQAKLRMITMRFMKEKRIPIRSINRLGK
ncbi:MAG: hypothetical protein KKA81_17320 [Bacteroidetes bacterium]|nr:hypothetical protein [Bacteroidota bacterium]